MRNAILCITLLAACQPEANDSPSTVPNDCGASELQYLIGENAANQDFPQSLGGLRIIPPNSAVTTDYRSNRLNVETDAAGIIQRIFCG